MLTVSRRDEPLLDFGPTLGEYKLETKILEFVGALAVLIGGSMMLFGFGMSSFAWLAFGAAVAGAGLWFWLSRRNDKIEICDRGLVLVYWGRRRAISWDEVQSVRKVASRSRVRVFEVPMRLPGTFQWLVTTKSGNTMLFDNRYRDFKQLGRSLSSRMASYHAQSYYTFLKSGGTLHFWSISLEPSGLRMNDSLMPWSTLRLVEVDEDSVTIHRVGAPIGQSVAQVTEVSNADLMRDVANLVIGERATLAPDLKPDVSATFVGAESRPVPPPLSHGEMDGTDSQNSEWGFRLAEFPVQQHNILSTLLIAFVLSVLVLLAGFFGSSAADMHLLAIAAATLLLGGFFGYVMKRRCDCLVVYEKGVSGVHWGTRVSFRWNDVAKIWQDVRRSESRFGFLLLSVRLSTFMEYTYRLQLRSNVVYVVNQDYPRVDEFGRLLSDYVTNVLLPEAAQSLDRGEEVPFGPVIVHHDWIRAGLSKVAWDDLKEARLCNGMLGFKKVGSWLDCASIRVSRIPNLFVLLNILQKKGKLRTISDE